MIGSTRDNFKNIKNWNKFSSYLWFSDELRMWLDISKVNFEENDFKTLENKFKKVFKDIDALEAGSIANISEKRQVGHYWLRNSSIAPNKNIKDNIENEIASIKSFGKEITNGVIKNKDGSNFTNVLWVGIGGSALGPLLIIESLQKDFSGLKFDFIDNIDPFLIEEKLHQLENVLSSTLIVVVSKSGGTPEPRIAMDIIRRKVEIENLEWSSQSIAITMKDSELYKKAFSEHWLKIFDLPDWVGGRTSITSSVGLLPLALINQDVDDFLLGASKMDKLTRSKDVIENPASLLAISWFLCGEGIGKRDMVVLPYRDRLQVFSKYLQQLVMESLGKKFNRSGEIVHQGITVFGNKGSTDQHAYVQQLRDGLDNFFCIFIELLDKPNNKEISCIDNPKDLISGFLQGTRSALSSEGRQSITITIDKLNSFTLGALIALFERTVSFYAELININAYDQPGVEAGKRAAVLVIEAQQKIKQILISGKSISFKKINEDLVDIEPETIFFILRQMCFGNNSFQVEGRWSKPETLVFKMK